jgi:hypothetical protein
MDENPIEESIKYLVDCGWSEDQAENLIKAIYDKSGERLWEMAPLWIEHCGECMKYVHGMLGAVAIGLIKVTRGEESEWLFSLNDKGLKVGEQMFKEENDHGV